MSQPTIEQYFNVRKRPAVEDLKLQAAKQIKIEDGVVTNPKTVTLVQNLPRKTRTRSRNEGSSQDIQSLFGKMKKVERCVTPPPNDQPETPKNEELDAIKKKLCKSSRLAQLKEAIDKFKEGDKLLKAAEKKTQLSQSPTLKAFKALEFEYVSPQKVQSPEKAYLSPKKDSVRRNILGVLSPVKKPLFQEPPSSLNLPFKYRHVQEMFRAVDTVCQIMHNRHEAITFKKVRTAVEEMSKRSFTEKHLGQIKRIFPDAFDFKQEKLRQYGSRQEQWELIITPRIETEALTAEVLLARRRKLHDLLLVLTKKYHDEFLQSLVPPLKLDASKLTRWHPEFNIEKVPDLEIAPLPEQPVEEVLTSARQVLDKARDIFNCNTRMNRALAKLQQTEAPPEVPKMQESLLKGIPKSLLEKVRQRQAAKALLSMTRSADKDKEIQLYAKLPEIARLTRSLFVTEKKNVLQLDAVMDKLKNSYRCFLSKPDLEEHLRTIAKEAPDWLVFHNIRNQIFVKLAKNDDLSLVCKKLETRLKELQDYA